MISKRMGRMPINDIAVLRLAVHIRKSYNVDFAKLPTYEFDGVFPVSIYGCGRMERLNGTRSEFLLKTTMTTKRTADCVNYRNPGCLSRESCQHICAISNYCASGKGDSGGPIVFPDGTVVGLVTGEFGTRINRRKNRNFPPQEERIFTRTFHFLNFIHHHERNHIIKLLN